MEKILSVNNSRIKDAVRLMSGAKARRESGKFIIEGVRLCTDAALSGVEIEELYFTAHALKSYSDELENLIDKAKSCFEITSEISKKISDTAASQEVFCVCRMIDNKKCLSQTDENGKYIVLENIQDPANLGAVCRTAEALGMSGAVIFSGCDIYNPKAQRASMGALFRLPITEIENISELFEYAENKNIKTVASVVDKKAMKITDVDFNGGVFCIIGNEGNGVSAETKEKSDILTTIPMPGRAESLNASMAACIVMWEMMS